MLVVCSYTFNKHCSYVEARGKFQISHVFPSTIETLAENEKAMFEACQQMDVVNTTGLVGCHVSRSNIGGGAINLIYPNMEDEGNGF